MAKTSKEQHAEDERKLLTELQKNSQEKPDVLAKRCGFSRQKVWRLIKQLEEKHQIWGYTTVIDEKKNNLTHYTLLLKWTGKKINGMMVDNIISRKLDEMASKIGVTIESSYYVHGNYDWVVTFKTRDIIQAKRLCNILLLIHPGIIKEVSLLETLFMIKNHHIINPEPEILKTFG